jgi:hypothetical protein
MIYIDIEEKVWQDLPLAIELYSPGVMALIGRTE